MKSFTLKLAAAAVAAACILPGTASASGGGSGPNVQYAVQGKIGEVITNPYKIAPLTAVIRNGGYQLKDAAVRIVPKHGGAEIKYNVSDGSAAHPCGHPGLRPLSRLQQHGRGVLHARRRHEGNPRRKRGLPHLRARDPH